MRVVHVCRVSVCCALFIPKTADAQAPSVDSYVLTLGEAVPERTAIGRDTRMVPQISVKTAREYSCLLPLLTRQDTQLNRIRLSIDGLPKGPRACPPMFGPAMAANQFDVSDGTFTLDIATGSRIDQYTLSVSDSLLSVTPAAGAFSSFAASSFRRAPRNSFSLVCTLPAPPQAFVCHEFATMLIDSLGVTEFTFLPSAQSPFPVKGDRQLDIRYFRYKEPADYGRAYDLLQRFSHRTMARATPNAWIELQNWRGIGISSYRCRPDQSQWCTDSLLRPRP